MDIWRDDLIEWEFDGEPVAVLARLIAEKSDRPIFTRPGLRALLMFADASYSPANLSAVADAAEAVGGVLAYEMLRPLERLFEHEAAEVRAAVMLFLQTCAALLQSAAAWQLPAMQALFWQMWFGP